jgi:hypothetical protein
MSQQKYKMIDDEMDDVIGKPAKRKKRRNRQRQKQEIMSDDGNLNSELNLISPVKETVSETDFSHNLKELPIATLQEKFSFPLKFDKEQFIMDFSSGRSGSDTDNYT